ncbi:dTDP-4-dehydrorhamnose reductase [Sphingobacterium rhinopitheci]|uniref:dTDP-4-dehydrorhamnose reductase n=1 Tax=Sphingobacterium rhinopitheci TaxID=2781960 RepID=UPI001F51AABC|nr:dTDP-4-dehydrorhamnose reductase [Sphingobacterium rhinopitheci]MCI0920637.1 dTDP-4-dehydrorhamnose reductase [Sphingobacterium rhinopitheci]
MKIVVTGANGQLGSELRDILSEIPAVEAFFLDRKQLPLDQTMIIQDILGMYQPDVIIHAAAYTAVDRAEAEPQLADVVNHLASEEIAQYCRLNDAQLIAISTDYVFDGTSKVPLAEDAPVDPINVYGLTKLRGEQAIQKWLPDAIIIRTSWVYSTYGNNFVKTMLRLMTEREEIAVIADQIGSPTAAIDLAEAILAIISAADWVPGVYHYSNEGEISWFDFACAIKEIKGLACVVKPITTDEYPTAAKRPHYSLLDKSKIKTIYKLDIPNWYTSLERVLSSL